tara:strand:+ start:1696 stop:1935 length:240 start_codon:yes stop_codon:yes gene_type:complete
MGDTVIVYVAGKEMARGYTTSMGYVTHNQQTYISVIDFYTDMIQHTCALEFENCQMNQKQYNYCYRKVLCGRTPPDSLP